MRRILAGLLLILLALPVDPSPGLASEREDWLELARRGWNYRLRVPPRGRDMSIPVSINSRALTGAALCVIGEAPTAATLSLIDAFSDLTEDVFGKPLPMRYAGDSVRNCGSGRVVVLRLFSGLPPHRALTEDLSRLNEVYNLGLPQGRRYIVMTPAMAQTFFGRRGQVTHIMVKQAQGAQTSALERAFFRSILIEELFQAFTFGADILIADRRADFQSKLQEVPVNLSRLSWESSAFMRSLLRVTPASLCRFDVFMMHALARTEVEQTIDPAFVTYIGSHFAELEALAETTLADPRHASLVDRDCRRGVPVR